MAASTVVRVKRRLEQNPQDALVLMCKRKKTDTDAEPSLFVFRGTVETLEANQVQKIFPKTDTHFKSPPNLDDMLRKVRKQSKVKSSESRYNVVNRSRGLTDVCDEEEETMDLFDLQPKKSHEDDISAQFVYDLYTPVGQIPVIEDIYSAEDYSTYLCYDSHREAGQRGSESSEESDDSNDENNWRNDYPDSEHSSIGDEDMIKAVANCDIEDDLSSDCGEDKIYDNPSSADDIARYGAAYAQYKAKVIKEPNPLIHSTFMKGYDEENIEGYKDESDDGFYYGEDENEAEDIISDAEFCEPD